MNDHLYLRLSRGIARALMALAIFLGGVLSAAPPTQAAAPPTQAAPPPAPRAAPTALTVTLRADADATVDASAPGANFASAPLEAGGQKQIYVKFNLTALPANAVISGAKLRLKTLPVGVAASADISVGRADANWTETTINWNNKSGVTPGGDTTTVNLPGGNWEEWTVTPLVQAWHDGSQVNYGFALAAPDSASAIPFYSKETGPAPQLVIQLTVQDGPDDPDRPQEPYPDLGDAPDSSNHHGINNTAYSGVNGRFPTVWEGTPAGQAAGPLHLNRPAQAYLGDHMSREQDADIGPDADGPNNILRNAAGVIGDVADMDRGDDGWRNRGVPVSDCRRVTLNVRVHKRPGATASRDGDWQDTGVCTNDDGQQYRSYEWLVQDFMVDLTAIPAGGSVDIPVTTLAAYNQTPGEDHWMRFTLSDAPALRNPAGTLSDGRGPHPIATPATYAWGETEDVLQNPNPPGEPGQLVLRKAVEVNSTPVAYADTVTYKIRLKNDGGSAPVNAEIRDTLPYPLHTLGPIRVTEVSPGVSPLSAQVVYKSAPSPGVVVQEIRWRGTLNPGAEVAVAFDVHVHPVCRPDQETKEIENVANALKPDGDWEDVVRCPEVEDLPGVALEHAIIDAPIDVVALGPGLHIIPVKTGRIPWPAEMAQQRAWVRLTLSERPSNKPFNVDGIDYGDGRGYARPFRTGETEDYLLRPDGDSEAGPDAAVSVELTQIAPRPGHEADGPVWHAKVGYGNIGTAVAKEAKLAISFMPEVGDDDIFDVASSPDLGIEPTVAALQDIELGDLVPGVRGGVLVTVRSPVSPTQAASLADAFTVKAVITTSSDDVDPGNNEDSATKTPRWPLRFGFQSPDSPVLVRRGTTCSDVLNVEGVGRPGETVLFSDMGKSEMEVPVGGNGLWSTSLSSLGDGRHYLRASYAGSAYPRARGLAVVDTGMILDPITLTFTDSRGRVFKPNTLGWNSGGFRLHLPAGQGYEVGINICGDDEYTLIVIDFTGAGVVELTDEDGDGRYTGVLDLSSLMRSADASEEQTMTITVTTNDGETTYEGVVSLESTSGAVLAAESGQPIANATVTLLEQQTASEEGDAIYGQWASSGYGQSNPPDARRPGRLSLRPTGRNLPALRHGRRLSALSQRRHHGGGRPVARPGREPDARHLPRGRRDRGDQRRRLQPRRGHGQARLGCPLGKHGRGGASGCG